ncbi:MAG: hypothetical protein LUC43_02275 [Burkholderiales bacterium]|nr:hypothetical protein [Burkholderiales bacterium]
MKILLAVVCFLTMLLHAFFGYYLYTQGENVFYPEKVKAMLLEVVPAPAAVQPPVAQPPATHPTAPAAIVSPQPTPAAPAAAPETPSPQSEEAPKPENNSASLTVPYQTLGSVASLLASPAVAQQEKETHLIENFKMDDFGAKYRAIMETLGITPLLQAPNPPVANESFITGWSGYLQIQNALITFFLLILGLAVCCVSGRGPASRWIFATNFFFWISLGCFTWFWHPVNTPLAVVSLDFSFPGWYFIVGLSMLGALLSLLLFFAAMRSKEIPLKKGTPDIVKKEIEQSKLSPKVKKEVEAVAEEASRADPMAAQFAGEVVEGEQETKKSIIKEVGQLEKKVKAEVEKVEETFEGREEPKKGVFSFGRKARKKEAAVAAATASAAAKDASDKTTTSATANATAQSKDTDAAKKADEAAKDVPLTEKITEDLRDLAAEARKDFSHAKAELQELNAKKPEGQPDNASAKTEMPIVDTGSKVLRNLQNENGIKEDDSVIITPPPKN